MAIVEDLPTAPNCVTIRFEMLHQGDCIVQNVKVPPVVFLLVISIEAAGAG